MQEDGGVDSTKLKYVLYARKSTDDPQRQVRSINDQIAECRRLAEQLHLRLIEPPLTEKKSAKKPGKRPVFRQMLNDIKRGKYDGIIAWHPDRLARNMKEGGEIIDMIDEDIIKDMKFVMHHFTKDANGKMLLGMAFVLSKQYSDNLSQNVKRGVRRSFAEGKALNRKHGYKRDENGFQIPDGKNFELMVEAWRMRRQGVSLEAIAAYMNEHGYGKLVKSSGRTVQVTKQILSDIFKDPFYYGILIQAGQKIDLRQIYDFQPVTTEQDYLAIQALTDKHMLPFYQKKRAIYYPFKMMVTCAFCGSNMYVGASKGHTKRYLFYRCDNPLCLRKKRSVRGKVIMQFIYDFLQDGLHLTEKDYHDYYDGLTKITQSKRDKLSIELFSKQARRKLITRELTERSLKVLELEKGSTIRTVNESRIAELEVQQEELEQAIQQLKKQLVDPEQERLTLQQFLNLSKNAATVVKSANEIVKDKICRFIFLNFSVDEEKVASYQLKPPFDEMLKTRHVLTGGPTETTLELFLPLAEAILEHWNPESFDEKLLQGEAANEGYPVRDYVY
jgi:DNA invertase Pin-like site-specific DNA recombinase